MYLYIYIVLTWTVQSLRLLKSWLVQQLQCRDECFPKMGLPWGLVNAHEVLGWLCVPARILYVAHHSQEPYGYESSNTSCQKISVFKFVFFFQAPNDHVLNGNHPFQRHPHGIPWNTHSTLAESCRTLPCEQKGWWTENNGWLHDFFVAVVNGCQKKTTPLYRSFCMDWNLDHPLWLTRSSSQTRAVSWSVNKQSTKDVSHLLVWFLVHVSCQNSANRWLLGKNAKGGCDCYKIN